MHFLVGVYYSILAYVVRCMPLDIPLQQETEMDDINVIVTSLSSNYNAEAHWN